MSSGAREREKLSVFFYRDNYRRAVRLLSLLFILMLIQTLVIGYQFVTRPAPQYFATTSIGKVIPLAPVTQNAARQSTQAQMKLSDAVGMPKSQLTNKR
ncbi:MAG: hypothetical protein K0R12_933 [Gammaproteobacteria bacterium]|jgi:hypothetical protein|nr:hypothetical protein [Gammaproteobacteria bacterium]